MAWWPPARLAEAEQELATLTPMLAAPVARQPALLAQHRPRHPEHRARRCSAARSPPPRASSTRPSRSLERAVRLEDALVYTEPSEWAFPPRHALGAVLLEAGRPAEAETVYWEDLKRNRENGWALTGLVQALRGAEEGRPGRHRRGPAQDGAGARRRDAQRLAVRSRGDGDDGRGGSTAMSVAVVADDGGEARRSPPASPSSTSNAATPTARR